MAWDDRPNDFSQRRERARDGRSGAARSPRRGWEAQRASARRRPVALCSNDFTVLAATSSRVASDKETQVKATAIRRGGAAARHRIDEVIDPAHTRDVISRYLTMWDSRGGIGRHRLASWPSKF